MKRVALAATGVAVVGLAACTSSAPSAAPPSTPVATRSQVASSSQSAPSSPAVALSAAPPRCKVAYDAWQRGPGKGLVTALSAVGSVDQTGNVHQLMAALKTAKPALTRAAHYPMPTCADPRGYWPVLLLHVNAAATSTGSAATLTAAMKAVPTLTRELNAELKRTEG